MSRIVVDALGSPSYSAKHPKRSHERVIRSADLAIANFWQVNAHGADFSGADLNRANLFGSDMASANLSNVYWGKTTCPNGSMGGILC